MTGGPSLDDADHAILRLAADPPRKPTALATAIRALGHTEISFYRRLNQLLDMEAALAADPITVNRLRRARNRSRTGGSRR